MWVVLKISFEFVTAKPLGINSISGVYHDHSVTAVFPRMCQSSLMIQLTNQKAKGYKTVLLQTNHLSADK